MNRDHERPTLPPSGIDAETLSTMGPEALIDMLNAGPGPRDEARLLLALELV